MNNDRAHALADTSDVDVLLVAEPLPEDFRRRGELVDPGVPGWR